MLPTCRPTGTDNAAQLTPPRCTPLRRTGFPFVSQYRAHGAGGAAGELGAATPRSRARADGCDRRPGRQDLRGGPACPASAVPRDGPIPPARHLALGRPVFEAHTVVFSPRYPQTYPCSRNPSKVTVLQALLACFGQTPLPPIQLKSLNNLRRFSLFHTRSHTRKRAALRSASMSIRYRFRPLCPRAAA